MLTRTMDLPKLYSWCADWWPLLPTPEEYAEEADFYRRTIMGESAASGASAELSRTLLELGSGGGNNASHLKRHFAMTLADLLPHILDVSQALNPEGEHVAGEMRAVRLDRRFHAVFIHDPIHFMATLEDLEAAIATAWAYCNPDGVALFMPDHTLVSYKPSTSHGGHDGADRALRYLKWDVELDDASDSFRTMTFYVMRAADSDVEIAKDEWVFRLFSEQTRKDTFAAAGFDVKTAEYELDDPEMTTLHAFIGAQPAEEKRENGKSWGQSQVPE